jgi:hypothetical protein
VTPMEEFRRWLRRGQTSEKVVTGIAGILAVALLAWVLLPTDSSSGTDEVDAGDAAAVAATPAAGAAAGSAAPAEASTALGDAGTVAPGSPVTEAGAAATTPTAGGAGPTATAAGSSAPACPPSSAQGVTDSTILVAVTNPDLGALNAIINIPSPPQQRAMNQAVVDWINKGGGVACRKIVVKQYSDNPIDANAEHALCLEIIAAKPFVNVGGLYTPQNEDCLAQNKIPTYLLSSTSGTRLAKYRKYLFSYYNAHAQSFRDYVFGARSLGWFDGMAKLGVLHDNCDPGQLAALLPVLAEAGHPKDRISFYDIGCPASAEAAQGPIQQAVLKFKADGVSHVMSGGVTLHQFASLAAKQSYTPEYAVSDADETIFYSEGQAKPEAAFDGALAITGSKYGGYTTGIDPGPATKRCDEIMNAAGLPTTQELNAYAGGVCNTWFLFLESAKRVSTITAEALGPALDTLGVYDMSYPGGQGNWNKPGTNYVTGFWRPARFDGQGCRCWKIADPAWRNGF